MTRRLPEPALLVAAFTVAAAVSIQLGRMVAAGSVRNVGLLVIVVGVAVAAHLTPMQFLSFSLVVAPLPLFMQGLGVSLTVGLVVGLWLLIAAHPPRTAVASTRPVALVVVLLVALYLVALARGATDNLAADVGAFARAAVGIALFAACLVVVRTPQQIRQAFAAIAGAGAFVLGVTLVQLAAPGVPIPGLVGGVGTVQQDLYGIENNLRVGGPLNDYELLGEFFALTAVTALVLCLTTATLRRRVMWFSLSAALVFGLITTSTRSGLFLLAVATCVAVAFLRRRVNMVHLAVPLAVSVVLFEPLIRLFQGEFRTAFLFERVRTLATSSSAFEALGRAELWRDFWAVRPRGLDLVFGQGVAFDYESFATFPHSLPLTLIFSVGALATAAFYALLVLLGYRGFARWRHEGSELGLLAALLVATFAINELKIEFVRVFNYEWFVWGLLGVCAAAGRARA